MGWIVPLLLTMQLGLLWIQGVQLHRQNQLLVDLRADIQDLADSLDAGQDSSQPQDDSGVVPLRHRGHRHSRIQRTSVVLGLQEEQDPAIQELQAAKESQQKAVKDAREAQSKLSLQENARKAEETRKLRGATDAWQRWSLAAVGLLGLAWFVRAYLRRR
jgi:hypothetical protein